jgi:hypothetical protein
VTTTPLPVAQAYLAWLRSQVTAETINDGVTELTTPFLDRHNDHLQIYAERREPDLFLLSDDGYIIAELKSAGVEARGRRREELFTEVLSGHGVRIQGTELQVETSADKLGQAAHNLLQAMLSIDDMFVLSQPKVESLFLEDVAKFLDENDVRYSPRVKFAGKSGLDHLVDFVIPHSKSAPERILQVINSPRRDRVESMLFVAGDTRAARGKDAEYLAIVNDAHKPPPREILVALKAYDITVATWSQRETILQALAA